MPFFKTTYNIFTKPWEDEAFDNNWMDSDKLILPPKRDWDYARDLKVEDVSLWEVLYQASGGIGVYAAWDPYAEFYMITTGFTTSSNDPSVILYYGKNAYIKVQEKMKQLQIPFTKNDHWVEPEMMWLYE
jgi:hypothetical protein